MFQSVLRSLWEFFNSILGNSPFAKLLAGFLTIGCLNGLFAMLRAAGWGESPTDKPDCDSKPVRPRNEFVRSGKAFALEMSIIRFFRRITGR
jgi:hypothetical protein